MRKDDTSLARADLIDMIRTRKRMEHRIKMRKELNQIENDALEEFERRLSSGQPYELDASYEDWISEAIRKAKEDADD